MIRGESKNECEWNDYTLSIVAEYNNNKNNNSDYNNNNVTMFLFVRYGLIDNLSYINCIQ